MSDSSREQLEEQLRAVQNAETQEIMKEIQTVLAKHGNRYGLIGKPQFQMAGNGAWVVTVDVGIAPIA